MTKKKLPPYKYGYKMVDVPLEEAQLPLSKANLKVIIGLSKISPGESFTLPYKNKNEWKTIHRFLSRNAAVKCSTIRATVKKSGPVLTITKTA